MISQYPNAIVFIAHISIPGASLRPRISKDGTQARAARQFHSLAAMPPSYVSATPRLNGGKGMETMSRRYWKYYAHTFIV